MTLFLLEHANTREKYTHLHINRQGGSDKEEEWSIKWKGEQRKGKEAIQKKQRGHRKRNEEKQWE